MVLALLWVEGYHHFFFWVWTAVYALRHGPLNLTLTRGPAGNRTTTCNLSAPSKMTPYQLSHEDDWLRDTITFIVPRPRSHHHQRRLHLASHNRSEFQPTHLDGVESSFLGIVNDYNYFSCSVPVANYFGIMPVPPAPDALDDYRWDQIVQALGWKATLAFRRQNMQQHICSLLHCATNTQVMQSRTMERTAM